MVVPACRKHSAAATARLASQEPNEVAEVIWTTATDGTDRQRCISGDDAETTLSCRYEEDAGILRRAVSGRWILP